MSVGDQWTVSGNLLNIYQCDRLLATFTLTSVEDFEGERCARIVGALTEWPSKKPPEVGCELLFSLDRKMPVVSTMTFKSRSRESKITARLRKPGPRGKDEKTEEEEQ